MPTYLLHLAQAHLNFRLAELESLAALFKINVDFSKYDADSPFLMIDLDNDKQASDWIKRSILSKGIYEFYAQGETYEAVHANLKGSKQLPSIVENYRDCSFKFDFESIGGKHKQSMKDKISIINSFAYLDFQGKIDMKNAQETFTLIEEYEQISAHESASKPFNIIFGRLIQKSNRSAMDYLDLKKRPFKGTTSFEAELSLVTANIAQVTPGSLMYDPFAGTGSFLVAGAHFGALVMGSDIDGRMVRGKGSNQNIMNNFKYYNNVRNFIDVMVMDFTNNALRKDLPIDSIICDPPYGIRESIKVLGAKNEEKFSGKENIEIDGTKAFLRRDYIPTKKPYSLDSLLDDLLQFSSERLPINGRLAFWMPTANDENVETIIPLHSNLELKYNCVQDFNKWSRRLLVYINRGKDFNGPTNSGMERSKSNFRDRYFTNFN